MYPTNGVTQQCFMCIANDDYAYFANYVLISGHNPNTHIINGYRKYRVWLNV